MLPPPLSIPPQFAGRRRAALNFLTAHSGLVICALFLLVGLALAGNYGISPDDGRQRQIAVGNWDYILGRADHIATRAYIDRYYGAAFELPLLLAERALGLTDNYHIHRLRLTLTHLFFIIGAFFCYRLACHLFGNRLIAILALLIFLLHPRLYAHSFFNSKDLPFVSMFVLTLYLLERAFRRDTPGAFILLGIAVGLLTNLRIMGAMLLPAVLAMRGLDLLYAGSGMERKSILRSGGGFVLAAGLTLYAITPYAWTNPADYLATNLALTINHPTVVWQLFQGEWFLSNQLPPHYTVTWFSITTPPLIMLLGLVGMATGAAGICRRPGAVFRNTRMRFAGLLLAAFLLPPLAAALLGSNQYDNWRHSYFLYAPFCLLAAGGLGGLANRFSRGRPGRAGVYGLTGLGLGLVLLQMTQLHPGQYDYFNFLGERTAPEYLRTQYQMNSWRLAYREGLAQLLESHPGETLVVLGGQDLERQREILPAAARRRLPAAGSRADYELRKPSSSQPDLAFNSRYRRQIYSNTLIAARPLNAARMTPAAIAAYRELYRQATAGDPIIRADYDVYLNDQRLTFVRENCVLEEPDAWFGVRIFPRRPETLPPPLRQDFSSYAALRTPGVRLDNLCLAVIQLPDYARDDLILFRSTAEPYRPGGLPAWAELYSLSRPGLGELIADYRRNQPKPANRDAFEVFLDQESGRNRLLYAKEDCTPAEYATPLTLHIYPVNLADLPAEHQGNGFDNRDFSLDQYGGRPGGECLAVVFLPDYPIAAIRTGQEGRWEVNLYPPANPEQLRAAYAALSNSQPAAQADFDMYRHDNRLIYLRETCAAGDTAAGFFLHIIPVDGADLPVERQAAGFANLDFAFARWGGFFDGKCLAAIPLPEYPIKAIRTGQHLPGSGEVWAAELTGER